MEIQEDLDLIEEEDEILSSEEESFLEESENEYKGGRTTLDMYLDTEYCDKGALSIQVFCIFSTPSIEYTFSFIIVHEEYKEHFSNSFIKNFGKEESCYVFFDNIRSKQSSIPILDYFLLTVEKNEKIKFPKHDLVNIYTNVWFYYSLQDLNIAFGIDYMKKLYLSKNNPVNQWRSVSGFFSQTMSNHRGQYKFNIKLKDINGLSKFGLESLAESYNIPFKKDPILDDYKSRMDEAVVDHPERFLKYGLEDAKVQYLIMQKAVEGFNKIITESLNVNDPNELFTLNNIPMTLGRLVTRVYQKYLKNIALQGDLAIQASMIKNSVLNKCHNNFLTSQGIQQEIKKLKSLESLRDKLNSDDEFREGVET